MRAVAREFERKGAANAARGAGDESDAGRGQRLIRCGKDIGEGEGKAGQDRARRRRFLQSLRRSLGHDAHSGRRPILPPSDGIRPRPLASSRARPWLGASARLGQQRHLRAILFHEVGERRRIVAGEAVVGELRAGGSRPLVAHGAVDAVDRQKGQRVRSRYTRRISSSVCVAASSLSFCGVSMP